ncbi:hypothetical protein ABZ863_12705 [Saccharomonospora sp. NPDC046836]|uniref:hypothetical protein n=1 Tax=Saccharomonospora sp. NPDC046836 TaxID=3156921 RepID=UPI00340CEB66
MLTEEQCAEIASALADDDVGKAEVMLYAARYPREALPAKESFTEQERKWATHVRSLRLPADVDLASAMRRLDGAIRSEIADLFERWEAGDDRLAHSLRQLGAHLLEHACSVVERTGLPVAQVPASPNGSGPTVVDDLRDLAGVLERVLTSLQTLARLSSQPGDELAVPTDDPDAMLRRIDRAVDADVGRLYERKDDGDDAVLPVLRRRARHLLELGTCEAGEAGIDVTGVETAVEAAFELPDA